MLEWLDSEGLTRAAVLVNEEYVVIEKINNNLVAHYVSAGDGLMYKLSGESQQEGKVFTIEVSSLAIIEVSSSDSNDLFSQLEVEFSAGAYAGAPLYEFVL